MCCEHMGLVLWLFLAFLVTSCLPRVIHCLHPAEGTYKCATMVLLLSQKQGCVALQLSVG